MKLRMQEDIKRGWKKDLLVVSICCITYNHEKYISDALDGFLMQETDFPFEILIHDDASTDNTPDIIRKYEEKYPDIIKPIFQKENQKSKLGSGMNPTFNYPRAKGKYIALCEGDDYWTEPLKLQKQVKFLEARDEYSLCVGGYIRKNVATGEQKKNIKVVNKKDFDFGYTFSLADTNKDWITKTLTIMFRNECLKGFDISAFKFSRDVHTYHHLLKKGLGFYFTEIFGVYHVHGNGFHSGSSRTEKIVIHAKIYREIYLYYRDEVSRLHYLRMIKELLKNGVNFSDNEHSKLSLVKEGFKISKGFWEKVLVVKSCIPTLNKIHLTSKQ